MKRLAPHLLAAVTVIVTFFLGVILGFIEFGTKYHDHFQGHFVDPIWSSYYGLGFEPSLIWYQIQGTYRYGFIDQFGIFIWPIIAGIAIYWGVLGILRMPKSRTSSGIRVALILSVFVITPMPRLNPVGMIFLPLYPIGFLFSIPY